MKTAIALAFVAIVASLATAWFYLLRGKRSTKHDGARMARALAWRVGLSVLLLACLLLGWRLGYIQPTGLAVSR